MKLLLLGSTGMIGSRIAAEARDRGHDITEASRSAGEGRIALDVNDTDALANAASGHDAMVSAIAPPRDGSEQTAPLLAAGRSILAAAEQSGVTRIAFVGGAGSLLLPDGSRNVDQDGFPDEYKGEALAHGELLELLRNEGAATEWSYLSPAAVIQPGERTGEFTLGGDHLVVAADGSSEISAEDFAIALVDELENNNHVRKRFTLGYA